MPRNRHTPKNTVKQMAIFLADNQSGMSRWQDDFLVTGKGGGTTDYARYKQALRELVPRLSNLISMNAVKARGDVKRRKLSAELNELVTADSFRAEEINIDLAEMAMLAPINEAALQEAFEEFARFWQHAEYYKEKVGEITPKSRYEHESQMWVERAKEEIAAGEISRGMLLAPPFETTDDGAVVVNPETNEPIRILYTAAMPPKVAELIYAMPESAKAEIAAAMNDAQSLANWYMSRTFEAGEKLPVLGDGVLKRQEIEKLLDSGELSQLMLGGTND